MKKPFIVGVDGSEPSLQALDWAVAEAARQDAPVRIVHAAAFDSYIQMAIPPGTTPTSHRALAEKIVTTASERAARIGPGVATSADIVPDEPVGVLVGLAPEAYAVVVGNRGQGEIASMLLGSTSLTVVGRAPCPVVVVRGADPNIDGDFGRVCLGVGSHGESSAVVRFAFEAAQGREAELHALHAWQHRTAEQADRPETPQGTDPDAAAAAQLLDDALGQVRKDYPKVTVRTSTPEGRARTPLLEASKSSDLLVVGAHQRTGLPGLQLGRVNHALLHQAACPVAVVPQTT
ncbi:universal stress protein [Actinacidiphila acididurans]|uniref:Universal stress protein n=1 Tax=Actinacidiphila acididurans TaxID=2784346 RepID=A0ABS2TU82_9ACTN|nr:universal stress protein [Actinacidiphila acididurans]MBM9506392.1 universal stress protein [Actinacidiphila acididurans]